MMIDMAEDPAGRRAAPSDQTELSPSESPTEHAYAWALDRFDDDTIRFAPQRTTLWLRVCAALTAASVAALVGVLIFVMHDRASSASQPKTGPQTTTQVSAPIAQTTAAVPTITKTETVSAPAPVEAVRTPVPAAGTQTFVICADGREGVVGGHTSCEFAENVRRAFNRSSDGSDVIAFSPVTGERYEMLCSGGYHANFNDGSQRVATRCVGGDNDSAEVVIW
jgi:hypothetical protein